MLHRLIKQFDTIAPVSTLDAHCDIPCKIYDPISAQLAALSVIRFMDQ
ncbi:MAG: superoxide dismutase [Ni], partial [Parahaliea sp.]